MFFGTYIHITFYTTTFCASLASLLTLPGASPVASASFISSSCTTHLYKRWTYMFFWKYIHKTFYTTTFCASLASLYTMPNIFPVVFLDLCTSACVNRVPWRVCESLAESKYKPTTTTNPCLLQFLNHPCITERSRFAFRLYTHILNIAYRNLK